MFKSGALRHRNFRMLWIATLLSSTARWADLVVVGWLTLVLTDSPLMVGIVTGCKMAGYLLAPMMGVFADRMDRRKLLIMASLISGGVTLTMLVLLLADALNIGHLIVLSLISSLTWALDHPTRQAFIPDLVGKDDLTNAVAMNAVATEMTVVIGPAFGGLLIPAFGMSGAYALIALIYLLDLGALLRLKHAKHPIEQAPPRKHEPPLKSLVAGFHYAWGNQTVLVLLLIAFMLNFFVAPYRYSFLPLFSRYVLDAGPTGYGMLTATAGLGALTAGLLVVSLGNFQRRGLFVVAGGLLWPATLFMFSLSESYYLSLGIVFFAGLAQAITWTLIATLILSNTAPEMRGRVMGLRTGVVISLPFGNLFAGAVAETFGVQIALGAYGICAAALMALIILKVPALKKLK